MVFYEWKTAKDGKQPAFLTLPDGKPFAFAGLWETWHNKENESTYRSCTIITREASESMKEIHHQMPVILKHEAFESWLDTKNQDVERLQEIIQNQIHTKLISVPVSNWVNSVRNNGPENIRPAE